MAIRVQSIGRGEPAPLILKQGGHSKCQRIIIVKHIHSPLTLKELQHAITIRRIERPISIRRLQSAIKIERIQHPVTVRKIENPVSIQPLRAKSDTIQVFGSNLRRAIQTDEQGRLLISGQIQVSPVRYTEAVYLQQPCTDVWSYTPIQNVSVETTWSFAIINPSTHHVIAQLQISPNKTTFATDAETSVEPGGMNLLTPLHFLKYARIRYRLAEPGNPINIDLYYQAQSN